jgi:hydrogenase maturation protein HypF
MATTSPTPQLRKQIRVRGVVQGVGFRPFVFNLAQKFGLTGYVLNSSAGVTVEIEGTDVAIEQFIHAFTDSPPPLARIEEVSITDIDPLGDVRFAIRESCAETGEFVLVSPDVATCENCWSDFGDPANRRYGYPFTNCTNCGPRYTIINDIPYDRPATTMSAFAMCADCKEEYHDPSDRRFHAQPNACPVCGPGLALAKRGTLRPEEGWCFQSRDLSLGLVRKARKLLHEGNIVAVKGLGGFLLACDAQNDYAVQQLRLRKRRSDKPFAVMSRDIESVERFCYVDESERASLLSVRRPIVVLRRLENASISRTIAPGNETIGVMLPYTPLHYLLFSNSPNSPSEFPALVMTSGNISEEPIVISNEEAWRRLDGVADWFLFHDRGIHMRVDDSVVRTFEGRERVLRRARGYVPDPVDLGMPMHEILACGPDLKNTFCLTKDKYAILSQHIGDMENYETLQFFQETLANLKSLFRVEPQAVAYDLHPGYMSTRIARQMPIPHQIGVQHHHAHIASCMAENHLKCKVIGVAFDGTGYGIDGQIWGGEFMVADYLTFERRAHLRYIPLAGGDAAIRQPWRAALGYLNETFGANLPEDAYRFRGVPEKRLSLVCTMLARRINTVQTSSCGRLFDAVASLIGVRQEVSFEGQAAIELESLAIVGIEECYSFEIEEGDPLKVDMRSMVEQIVRDLSLRKSPGWISACFHNTLAAAIVEVCRRIRRSDHIKRVCLSGGTFQNMFLLDRTVRGLRSSGFEVFLHQKVPPNDGGISLGQAVIANEVMQRG